MYRAIVCITQGELKGPNPAFRTHKACERYWLHRMYQDGPVIESFNVYACGNAWDKDRVKLHGRFLRIRDKIQPMNPNEIHELLNSLQQMKDSDVDLEIGDMQMQMWERKHGIQLTH